MNIVSIYKQFPLEQDCLSHLENVRWPDKKPVCPYCNSNKTSPLPKEYRHHCNNCNTTFSVTVGTIFHHTHLPLQKWFLAVSLILNAKKGIAARQLARDLEVNKNTAWSLEMRIRKAMIETKQRELLHGIVEMDETYIGGKPRKGIGGEPLKRGRGTKKIPVVGMIERNGKVKAKAIKNHKLDHKTLKALVRANVDTSNTTLITDEYRGYIGMGRIVNHEVVNHQAWYVDGYKHTNNIEGFWALLKRGITGQYHKVSLKYLDKYITEFCYRHNNRENVDLFDMTIIRGLQSLPIKA